MQFTSDFQEKDIVFGGDKKLAKIMDEIQELFPLNKGITVQSECPIGLIGDDIEAVSKQKSKEYEGKTIVPVRCEGFRGVSQSLGHHIANDAIRDWVFDKVGRQAGPIRADALRRRHHRRLQHRRRRLVVAHPARRDGPARDRAVVRRRQPGGARGDAEGQAQPDPLLPLDELHLRGTWKRSTAFRGGVQLLRPDQDRASRCARSPSLFDDKIKEGAERVIAKYQPLMDAVIAKYRPRLEGKKVMLFVGGLRPRHVIGAYEDLGMEVVGTGYEFGHNDDYQRTAHVRARTAR